MAITWHQSALVQVSSLVDALLRRAVELDHHGAVHLGPSSVHAVGIHVVKGCNPSLRMWLSCVLAGYLKHVLVGLTAHMLV